MRGIVTIENSTLGEDIDADLQGLILPEQLAWLDEKNVPKGLKFNWRNVAAKHSITHLRYRALTIELVSEACFYQTSNV